MKQIDPRDYNIPMTGDPRLHQNLAWYASDDGRVLGVVVRDLIDNDYSWVVLTENDQGPGYSCIEMGASLPTQEEATTILHAMMIAATNKAMP